MTDPMPKLDRSEIERLVELYKSWREAYGQDGLRQWDILASALVHWLGANSAALLELEQDARRLDWLIDNCAYWPMPNGDTLRENSREAIDAKLRGGES